VLRIAKEEEGKVKTSWWVNITSINTDGDGIDSQKKAPDITNT